MLACCGIVFRTYKVRISIRLLVFPESLHATAGVVSQIDHNVFQVRSVAVNEHLKGLIMHGKVFSLAKALNSPGV
jgi:hypothetical protein